MNPEKVSVRLRLLSPLGRYPAADVKVGNCLLTVRDGIGFSAVVARPGRTHGLGVTHHSEIEIFALEEVRFLAAIALALPPDRGMVYAYPLPLHDDLLPARRNGRLAGMWDASALEMRAREMAAGIRQEDWRCSGEMLPPVSGGPPHALHDEPLDLKVLTQILRGTNLRDWLALRGLGALLRADMLHARRAFAEPAIMMLHVAMEASFRMVLERLKASGNPDPSAWDAGAYIDSVFNPQIVSGRYFADWYDDRIKTSHPESRLGTFAFPPLTADDFYDLRWALHHVYVHLLADHIWTEA